MSGDALRWFNCRPKHSFVDWDQLTDQFVAHFFIVAEVPIHMEDFRKCKRQPNEDFHAYVQRFRKLVAKMEETPNVKEIVKICGSNSGDTVVYVAIPPCKSFEELFERMHEYEELMVSKQIQKVAPTIAINAVTKAGGYKTHEKSSEQSQSCQQDFKKGGHSYNGEKSQRQWKKPEDYSFDVADTEHWFDALVAANVISMFEPKYEVRDEDKSDDNFCRYHQVKGHPTKECHTL